MSGKVRLGRSDGISYYFEDGVIFNEGGKLGKKSNGEAPTRIQVLARIPAMLETSQKLLANLIAIEHNRDKGVLPLDECCTEVLKLLVEVRGMEAIDAHPEITGVLGMMGAILNECQRCVLRVMGREKMATQKDSGAYGQYLLTLIEANTNTLKAKPIPLSTEEVDYYLSIISHVWDIIVQAGDRQLETRHMSRLASRFSALLAARRGANMLPTSPYIELTERSKTWIENYQKDYKE